MPARVSKRLLTLAHAFIIHSCSGVCDWCLTFLFARSACSAFTENDSFPANHGARWNSLSEFAYTVQLLQRVASRLSSPSLYPAWWPNTSGFHQKKPWTNSHAHFFCWLRTLMFCNDMKMMLGSLTVRSSCSMFQLFQSRNMMSTDWITQKLLNFHWWSQGYRPKSDLKYPGCKQHVLKPR